MEPFCLVISGITNCQCEQVAANTRAEDLENANQCQNQHSFLTSIMDDQPLSESGIKIQEVNAL